MPSVELLSTIFFDKCISIKKGLFTIEICGKANTYPEVIGTTILWDCPLIDVALNVQVTVDVKIFLFSFKTAFTLCVR